MAGEKKIPMRQCLGCRELKPKNELARIVRTPEGGIILDVSHKANGRGAYFCPDRKCLEAAFKKKAAERALGCPIPEEIRQMLLDGLEA